MQLRAYMGAAIYRRNNVLVIPDVHFERIVSGGGCKDDQLFKFTVATASDINKVTGRFPLSSICGPGEDVGKQNRIVVTRVPQAFKDAMGSMYNTDDVTMRAYQGATWSGTEPSNQLTENAGHLGKLDYPTCPRLHGYHVYDSEPRAV